MMAFLKAVLGWIVGALVWAVLAAVLFEIWGNLPGFDVNGLVAALMEMPNDLPGILLFLAIGLGLFHLFGWRTSWGWAGLVSAVLYLLATGAAWHFVAPATAKLVFGGFPIEAFWTEVYNGWSKGALPAPLLGSVVIGQKVATLIGGIAAGLTFNAVAGAARAARRAKRTRPVDFGSGL